MITSAKADIAGKDSLKPMSETVFRRDTYERLVEELEQLTTEGRINIARTIESARELGDLKENADYHAAKDDQGRMEARIRQLTAMLEDAIVLDDDSSADGPRSQTVEVGSVVSIRYDGDDDVEQYLVGSIEERREGIEVVSPGSPLGRALLGAQVGSKVAYQTPNGSELTVEIVDVGA